MENNIRYFKDMSQGNQQFVIIEGTKVIRKYIMGDKVWKICKPKDLIKDYGHKDQKSYIKRLKELEYIEKYEDMTDFVDWYK